MSDQSPKLDRLPDLGGVDLSPVKGAGAILAVVGIAVFTALLFIDPGRAWSGVLAGLCVPVFLAAGSLVFLSLHRICNARWHAPLKRLLEGLSAGLPLALAGFLVFALFGASYVYDWFNLSGTPGHEQLFKGATKAAWMSPLRWTVSCVLVLVLWIGLRWRITGLSRAQDAGVAVGGSTQAWSLILLFAGIYSFTLLAWDLLLVLNVHAVSAMWGFYHLVGAGQAALGLLALLVAVLARGPLGGAVRRHTRQDLGTWLVGLSCFWAYIGFAQYVIIAFANMDEETQLLIVRLQHGYQYALYAEAVLRLPVPFFLLLSQHTRTRPAFLALAGVSILLGAGIDLAWWVVPALFPNGVPAFAGIPEVLVAGGFLGGTLLLAYQYWRANGVVPRQDPDLLPAINAEHLH